MGERWQPEYVIALAPDPASAAAARRLAAPAQWSDTGCDERAVWGRYLGSGGEPYEAAVELEEAVSRCTCLSRKVPCKHVLGLLLLWSAGTVVDDVAPPPAVARWLRRRAARAGAAPAGPPVAPAVGLEVGGAPAEAAAAVAEQVDEEVDEAPEPVGDEGAVVVPEPGRTPDASRRAAERAARVAAGLAELDRWLGDQVRTGLADAGLDRPEPWEAMAARLVDAQAGSLANRLRRVAGRIAEAPDHHDLVLGELGVLHLLACGGRRTARLPGSLADAVRGAIGWAPRQDDVRASVPVTDRWLVAGRSDVQEDRIVVRRTWLQGSGSRRWAMVLSFAAFGQALEGGLPVGTTLAADLHFYPSARPLRALVGLVHDGPRRPGAEPGQPGLGGVSSSLAVAGLGEACDEVGIALAAEPWLERWPMAVLAAPALRAGRWVLDDGEGSLPVAPDALAAPGLMTLVALSAGRSLPLCAEWTPDGVVPLAAHLDDRVVDVGPHGPWGYG